MNNPVTIAGIVVALLGAGTVGLFAFQNHTRTTQLSLDVGVAAVQLSEPVMIPALMGICFAAGLVIGGGYFLASSMAANRKVRRLEQELALAGGNTGDGWR